MSRFKGVTMDMSTKGKEKLIKVISSRLSIENLDKVFKILSSNLCENYFSMIVKFTEGKRLNTDGADN